MKTKFIKIIILYIALQLAGKVATAQTFAGTGKSYYLTSENLIDAQDEALFNACLDAVISSGYWTIKDSDDNCLYSVSKRKKYKTYYVYDEHGKFYAVLTKQTLNSIASVVGIPVLTFETEKNVVIAKAIYVIKNNEQETVKAPRGKMRSYIGLGSIGYGWRTDLNNIKNPYWKNVANNGLFATLGDFKVGNKYFGIAFSLVGYDKFLNLATPFEARGSNTGPQSLDSTSSASGIYNLTFDKISLGKLTWQYDINLNRYSNKHFYPYKFIISPFISVIPVEYSFVKMPFTYYNNIDQNTEVVRAGTTTILTDWFKTFETGIKIKSSLYSLEAGYTWRSGNKNFVQNYTLEDYRNNIETGSRSLSMHYSYLYLKLGICFDWMQHPRHS